MADVKQTYKLVSDQLSYYFTDLNEILTLFNYKVNRTISVKDSQNSYSHKSLFKKGCWGYKRPVKRSNKFLFLVRSKDFTSKFLNQTKTSYFLKIFMRLK